MTVFIAQLEREIQVGYPRFRSLGMGFSPFSFYFLSVLILFVPLMMIFITLIMISFSDVFADKQHVTPRLSFINVLALNKLLRSEIFISEDGQLRAVHLVLNFEPLSNAF